MDYVMHLDDGVEIFKGEEFADKACCPTLKEEVCGKHDEEEAKHVEVIEEEEMEVGRVQFSVYREMFSYGYGGEWGIAILVLISVIINFSTTSVSLYLAFTLAHKFKDSDEQQGHNNLTLLVIIILCLFFSFVGKFASNKIFMRVSLMLHKDITEKLVQTDLKFFEENPHGRIVNRFSKDIATLDSIIFLFLEMLDYSVKCIFSVAVVSYVCPWILIIAVGSAFYLNHLRTINLVCTRDPIRLKYTLTSPINSII